MSKHILIRLFLCTHFGGLLAVCYGGVLAVCSKNWKFNRFFAEQKKGGYLVKKIDVAGMPKTAGMVNFTAFYAK
jgi:hypothetical protein